MCPTLALISIATPVGIESIVSWNRDFAVPHHDTKSELSPISALNWLCNHTFATFFLIAYTFSIGLRSGELPGHSKTLNLHHFWCVAPRQILLKNATSFGKSNSDSWKQIFGQNFFAFDGIHHSSTGITFPVPLKVKQPQNIFFGCVLALAQYDHSRGVLPYFFVYAETDIFELKNDFCQRM